MLFARCRGAFRNDRALERARTLAQSGIVSFSRRTITGALSTCGRQFQDWSAAYRLFERERFDADKLFGVCRQTLVESLEDHAPLVAVMDDTFVPKCGRKIAGTKWQHDPKGPAFQHQIAWGQRAIELSAMLPPANNAAHAARAVPIDLQLHNPRKMPPKASAEQRAAIVKQRRDNSVSHLGATRVAALRRSMDDEGEDKRSLVVAFDGGYTNKALFKAIPERTALVGRARKDAKLFAAPAQDAPQGRGRRRIYGARLATPEQLLGDQSVPWREASVFAAGKTRTFQYKTLCCRWHGAGERDLLLVVLRPLSTRPREKGRRLYFAYPGYLLCSDPQLPVQQVVQAYIWRWEIEVGFREQKTTLGLGQAQMRTLPAATAVLQFHACAYALLLLAAHHAHLTTPPRPKWQKPGDAHQRITLNQMVSLMRGDLWGRALGLANKTHFDATRHPATNPPKIQNNLQSAVLYATA
jgi:hypothetical protein